MKSKLTTIRNKTAYIKDRLVEVEELIKELEVDEALNTSNERFEKFDPSTMAGSTVNELDGYETETDCKSFCKTKVAAIAIVLLLLIGYVLSQ